MKILMINTVPFELNGISKVIMSYLKYKSDTVDMDFVASGSIAQGCEKEIRERGCRLFMLRNRKKNCIFYMYRLYKIMKNNRYDIVHIHGNSATMVFELIPAVMAKIAVRIVHSHNTKSSYMLLHMLLKPLFDRLYTNALACGCEAGKWLYGDREFEVIPNGIDLSTFRFDPVERKRLREQLQLVDEKVLCHVGEFNEQKNHKYLLNIFEKLCRESDDYKLMLIGSGPLYEKTKRLAEEYGLAEKIIFCGGVEHVEWYLSAADIFLFPSLFEGVPVTVIEAQAASLECLLSDRVSREVKVLESTRLLPLSAGQEEWLEAVRSCRPERINRKREMEQAGFSAEQSYRRLEAYYEKRLAAGKH